MLPRDAINGLIAGISGFMLLLGLGIVPDSAFGGERASDRIAKPAVRAEHKGKLPRSDVARPDQADDRLREEFPENAIRIEPAAALGGVHAQPEAAPLHGYGDFEGVVLVAPAKGEAFPGLVLVEPAAAPAKPEPVEAASDTAEDTGDIDIPEDLSATQDDPLEPVNRLFFAFNEVVDHLVFAPAARIYHTVLPEPVRIGVANVVRNASSPVILANDILQGNRQGASDTVVRFMVNSTIGVGGLLDAAGYMGVAYHNEDFGQTLAVWGVGSGPYMVVPVLGPSNPRDLTGIVVDTAFNPLTWILIDAPLEERLAPSAVELVVGREAILDDYATLRQSSPDLYASVRDIYGEKRQTEISNGDITGEPIPNMTSLPPTSVMTTVTPF
jgi:phospholipid-binding lipoprotein MlaA